MQYILTEEEYEQLADNSDAKARNAFEAKLIEVKQVVDKVASSITVTPTGVMLLDDTAQKTLQKLLDMNILKVESV